MLEDSSMCPSSQGELVRSILAQADAMSASPSLNPEARGDRLSRVWPEPLDPVAAEASLAKERAQLIDRSRA